MRSPALLLSLALPCTVLLAQDPANNAQKAERLVKAAVAFANANGVDKLIQQTNNADGRFHVGSGSQLYIFVYEFSGVCRAIGYDTQKLVGVNRWDLKDPDGKFFLREIIAMAKGKGSGWIDYKYTNPQTGRIQAKTSYVERVGDLVVGAGIYKD